MSSKFITFATLLLLTACTHVPTDDENSPFSNMPIGSKLVLKRSITMPANRHEAFLNHPSNLPASLTSDEQDTVCSLVMHSKDSSQRTIEPAEFRVGWVAGGLDYTLHHPIQVAFNDLSNPSIETHSKTL